MAQRNSSRKPRNSGASRRGGTRKGGGVPGWVWLVTGVLAGLFAAFLIFLVRFEAPATPATADKGKPVSEAKPRKEREPAKETAKSKPPAEKPAAKVEVAKAKPAPAQKPAEQPEKQPQKPTVNYDFYKILPQYEVVVSEEEARKPAAPTTTPGTYYLQVGAFRKMQEADERKAELAMLGFVSTIQTVTLDKENTWHRVRIGPVKDMRQLDRTKRQLQEHDIAFVTLREKS